MQAHRNFRPVQVQASKAPVLGWLIWRRIKGVNHALADQLDDDIGLCGAGAAQVVQCQLGDVLHQIAGGCQW